jgi:manganese/zinc/iron transport system substrate-binding protein
MTGLGNQLRRHRRPVLVALLLALPLLATGCIEGRRGFSDDGRLKVVCTTNIVGDTVGQIGGDEIQIITMMGAGVDPHMYKARESDVLALAEADIVFYSGWHLEAKLTDVFERMGGGVRTVAVAGGIPEERLVASADYANMHDPHVWFDVQLWSYAARRVTEVLADADPEHATVYRLRGEAYLDQLVELDEYIRSRVQDIPAEQRVLVTAHDAFGYFGRAYGFEVVGLQGISTASEAGTGDVRRLAELIASRRIPAIFIESSVPVRNIQAVQEATRARGWDVAIGGELYSDALGSPGTPEGTYLGMVRHNVETIVSALAPPTEQISNQMSE